MSEKVYRVIQWATGTVGKVALRHYIENPAFELAGVLVTNPEKVGKDAGDLVGLPPTGVLATDNVEKIIALDADCVHFAPLAQDVDMVCRLLRSGKNVVSALGPFYPTEAFRGDVERTEAACRDGGASFHGCGIHPGFVGDILPLTLTRLMNRIDRIEVFEIADKLRNPSVYIEFMGFGREPADLLARPGRSPEAPYMFAQSMEIVAKGLGLTIGNVTAKFDVASAVRDIAYPRGVVRKGTVAGQHYEWTGWADGKPLISYHCFWTMGPQNIEPAWDCGESGYRIRIEGDPAMELTMARPPAPEQAKPYLGLPWTAMAGVNVIPAVCDAAPGIITHFELGVPQLRGLFRPG